MTIDWIILKTPTISNIYANNCNLLAADGYGVIGSFTIKCKEIHLIFLKSTETKFENISRTTKITQKNIIHNDS